MSKLKVMSLDNLREFKLLQDAEFTSKIKELDDKTIKSVSVSSDGYTIYFYKITNPTSTAQASFQINLPSPVDISGKTDKVKNAVKDNFAGLDVDGNLIDSGKNASSFESAGSVATAKGEVLDYIGDIPVGAKAQTIVAYINELINFQASGEEGSLQAKIAQNTSAIQILNSDVTTNGSVAYTVATEIAKVIDEAPESFDTLKELAVWIQSHGTDALTMNSKILTNESDIAKIRALIGELPANAVSTNVVSWIIEYVGQALEDSDLSQYAKATDFNELKDKVTANSNAIAENAQSISNLDTKIGSIPTDSKATTIVSYAKELADAVSQAVSNLTNRVSTNEASIATLRTDLTANTNKITSNTTAIGVNASKIFALEELMGDGFEPITSSEINALFVSVTT